MLNNRLVFCKPDMMNIKYLESIFVLESYHSIPMGGHMGDYKKYTV